ncbi:ORF6N domain-containing protein [Variovorax sp. RB3P1]|uniref:ORF6N domain-containing protein n=1 Tax=Variovorax sp. RB3P1 TaxID=3443732 RepID=UPI003F4537D6
MSKKTILIGHAPLPAVTIGDTSLGIIEFNGQRAVTLGQVDAVHQRPKGTARRNFNVNRARLILGEDYMQMSADEFRTRFAGIISRRATGDVTLVFETGYLMLVKSFGDDLAWQVQRKLVTTYFRHQQAPEQTLKTRYAVGRRDTLNLEQASKLRDTLESAAKDLPEAARGHFMKQGWSKMRAHFKVHYREIPAAEFDEALSLLQRHVVGYEPPAVTQPAIGHVSPGALLSAATDFSAWLAMAPPLLVQAARLGIDAANEPARRGQRKAK